jgi:pyruvate kinase
MSRRAKIVCTLGPATSSADALAELIDAGMDVARMNFSHGDHADHQAVFDRVRAASARARRPIGVLADLQGPKIRLGRFADGPVMWETGEQVAITVDDIEGSHDRVSTTYRGLARDARKGDRLLVDDGKVGLVVDEVRGNDVICTVTEGGQVSNNKGLSLPGMNISVPPLSEKDVADLKFALGLGVDFIALSFVRSASDIDLVHQVMDDIGSPRIPVIAKLEKPEAVANLEAIVLAFDGVMVARGDLGVELPLEQVPLVQKRVVQVARENAKPVIVATQMLDSMIERSRPTRAEASDVANAVMDGADAVMLSGETSVGKYPTITVQTMARIIAAVEAESVQAPPLTHRPKTQPGAISDAAREIGERLDVAALVAFTQTGDTVRRLARLHSPLRLLAFTPMDSTYRQLSLTWGVQCFQVPPVDSTDEMVRQVDNSLSKVAGFNEGEQVVIVAGSPPNTTGSTNLIRVHRLGTEDI